MVLSASCHHSPSLMQFHVDVFRAISEAIEIISNGKHDPIRAHERIKTFYDWAQVAERTEVVYDTVVKSKQMELWERMKRFVRSSCSLNFAYVIGQNDGARPFRRTDILNHPCRGLSIFHVFGVVVPEGRYGFRC